MSRIAQPQGIKGSLKWIQRAVSNRQDLIQPVSIPKITWLSPVAEDEFAEYRDVDFLTLLGLDHLSTKLKEFWPKQGPQWDALGIFDDGCVLVEAKAHLSEFKSPASQAGAASRKKIEASLFDLSTALGVTQQRAWIEHYYQYTNRLAHLWWLRKNGINAHLLFVSFLGDVEMHGPNDPEEWIQAFVKAENKLGISSPTKLHPFIHHVFPKVSLLD